MDGRGWHPDARRHSPVISSRPALQRLQEIAQLEGWQAAAPYLGGGPAIAVGRGLDLSGHLDCYHPECQLQQVNEVFSRILHYFDKVVVAGPQAHEYAHCLPSGDAWFLETVVPSQIQVLLELRAIGVDSVVEFVQKDPACIVHFRQHAKEAGVEHLLKGHKQVAKELARSGSLRQLRKHKDHWDYTFDSPYLEHTSWGELEANKIPTVRDVATSVVVENMAHLTSDVTTARRLGLPLGARVPLHRFILERGGALSTEENVLLELELPTIEGVPIANLIELRNEESEYFAAFRTALRAAISERLVDGGDPRAVADRVRAEIINPALADIDRRLVAARSALSRKNSRLAGSTRYGRRSPVRVAHALRRGCRSRGVRFYISGESFAVRRCPIQHRTLGHVLPLAGRS